MLMLSAAHFLLPVWHTAVYFVAMSSSNRHKDPKKENYVLYRGPLVPSLSEYRFSLPKTHSTFPELTVNPVTLGMGTVFS